MGKNIYQTLNKVAVIREHVERPAKIRALRNGPTTRKPMPEGQENIQKPKTYPNRHPNTASPTKTEVYSHSDRGLRRHQIHPPHPPHTSPTMENRYVNGKP